MTILVTGATGNVGSHVVQQLLRRGAKVRAFVRYPVKASFTESVEVVKGELLDVDALRGAYTGISTLFLLNAVGADEFTQAITALNLAREVGIERVVYLSVIHSDLYVDVPHFAGKYGVERMIERLGFSATILRPAYFIGNDAAIANVIKSHGVYPMPVGSKGLAMIDARDVGEIGAIELIRRERGDRALPITRLNLVGPDTLTGASIASIWSEALGRNVAYGGDDAQAFEHNLRTVMPSWMAYDMRVMSQRFVSDGMLPQAGDLERLTQLLGRPLRSYREFAAETVAAA